MKKLIQSVLLGLIIGIFYFTTMSLITVPFLILIRMGFIEVENGSLSVLEMVQNLSYEINEIDVSLTSFSLSILIIQVVLFLILSIVTFIFMTKVLKVFLKSDSYFRCWYDILFIFILLVPEISIILSIFFNFPVKITVLSIFIISLVAVVLGIIMMNKVLPDLKKNEKKRYLLNTKGVE